MLEDVIELLTVQMLEDLFKNKKEMITISKTDLYKFCIKLIKLIKQIERGN